MVNLNKVSEDDFTVVYQVVFTNDYVEIFVKEHDDSTYSNVGTVLNSGDTETIVVSKDGQKYDIRADEYDSINGLVDQTFVEYVSLLPEPENVTVDKTGVDTFDIEFTDRSNSDGEFHVQIRPDGLSNFITVDTIQDDFSDGNRITSGIGPFDPDFYYVRIEVETDHSTSVSNVNTFEVERDGYSVTLYDDENDKYRYISWEEIINVNFTRTHTGVSNYKFDVGYDLSLENWVLSEVHLEYEDEFLFRGFLETVESDEKAFQTTVSGRGIEYDLANDEDVVEYGNIEAHKAVENYIQNRTSFQADVRDPSPRKTVNDITVKELDSSSDFNDEFSFGATTPLIVENGLIKTQQSGFFVEGETFNLNGTVSDTEGSSGESENMFDDVGFSDSTTVNVPYTIPSNNVGLAMRLRNPDDPDTDGDFEGAGFRVDIDGETISGFINGWTTGNDDYRWIDDSGISSDISGSTTIEVRVNSDGSGDRTLLDAVFLYDTRWNYTFDNSVDSDGYLSGPELYPDAQTITTNIADTPWNITEGTATVTMGSSNENPESLQLRINSFTWYPNDGSEQNVTNVITNFSNDIGTTVQSRVTLGRRDTTRDTQSPTDGFEGEQIDSWTVEIDGNDLAIIEDQTVEGTHLRNIIRIAKFAGMRVVSSHEPESKTLTVFRTNDIVKPEPNWTVENRKRTIDFRGYANDVTVRGKKDSNGNRPTRTVDDQSGKNEFGKVHFDRTDPTLSTNTDVSSEARKELGDKLQNSELTGSIDIVPISVTPGFTYEITWGNDSTSNVPMDEISYRESEGEASGTATFKRTLNIEEFISGLRDDTQRTKQVL